MSRVKNFLSTVFIGGLVVILPVAILVKIFIWLLQWVAQLIAPITGFVVAATHFNNLLAQFLAMLAIITACFFVGLVVKTAWGNWMYTSLEYWILARIPGYKMLKELFAKLQPQNEQKFSKPVLVSLDQGKHEFLGFITDEYGEGRYAVFVPTSPSPMNGFVIQTDAASLRFVDVSNEAMMKTVIACGVGSAAVVGRADEAEEK